MDLCYNIRGILFYVAPDDLKDIRSPFLQEIYEEYTALLF